MDGEMIISGMILSAQKLFHNVALSIHKLNGLLLKLKSKLLPEAFCQSSWQRRVSVSKRNAWTITWWVFSFDDSAHTIICKMHNRLAEGRDCFNLFPQIFNSSSLKWINIRKHAKFRTATTNFIAVTIWLYSFRRVLN